MSDDLVNRLKSCAKDCTMLGDEVDAAFFNEAATALTEARAEIERLTKRLDLLAVGFSVPDGGRYLADWQTRISKFKAAESELATLRDILVLCGELGGIGKDETPADYLRRLIDEVAGVESLRARVREVVGPFAAVVLPWGDIGSGMIDAKSVRAARQLMEEVK